MSYPSSGVTLERVCSEWGFSINNRQAELSQAFSSGLWAPDHGCLVTYQYGGVHTALLMLGHCSRSQRNPSCFSISLHTISLFTVHTATVAGPNLCPDKGSVCSVYSLVSWFKPPECCTWNWMSGESSPARLW